LELYLPKEIVAGEYFSVNSDCHTDRGTSTDCTIETNELYTKITMPSPDGENLFGDSSS